MVDSQLYVIHNISTYKYNLYYKQAIGATRGGLFDREEVRQIAHLKRLRKVYMLNRARRNPHLFNMALQHSEVQHYFPGNIQKSQVFHIQKILNFLNVITLF